MTASSAENVAPVTGHPRLWLTAADLPRLRSWASPQNPVYKSGIVPALDEALAIYNKEFYPGGQPNPKWPDSGIDNWVGRCTEAFAEFFAFMSLIDPDPAARAAHGQRAKNLLMYVIREAAKGRDPNTQSPAPFRGPQFATYNRANHWGEAFGLTVDWIYPLLSADDKALIRRVFMRWADENVHAATSGNEHPEPIGVLNDARLLADKKRLRWAINNYYTGHMRQLTLYGLSFDPQDDPPLDASAPPGKLGNTLKSYLDDALGAWLYQQYAVYEEPTAAASALHVSPEGLGVASGGLPPEGFLYGALIGNLHHSLLALWTAGYRDPRLFGPQIRMIESPFWDRVTEGFLASLLPEPEPIAGLPYLGQAYQVANYGDTQRFWVTPDQAEPFLSMAIHSAMTGNTRRASKAQWIAANAPEGGLSKMYHRMSAVWGNSHATLSILHFLAFDPTAKPAPDPRPAMPRAFYDRPLGRLVARTDWSPSASIFDYKCSWATIGHQFGDCNQFELWRKGEWLAKEQSGYANDVGAITSEFHNTVSIQNKVSSGADKPKSLQWFETGSWERGGQFTLGTNRGDPKVRVSIGPNWAAAQGDATDLYNRVAGERGDDASDVSHASRSIVWFEPDFVMVYDRATTRSDKRFKRFHLTSAGDSDVKGKLATFTTPKGQKLFVQTLLPAAAVLTASKAAPFNGIAQGEPTRSRLLVEDPAGPRDVRFLHILQGADAGASPAPAVLVQSSAGTPFAGAAAGGFAAVFPVDLTAPFARVTFSVPQATTMTIVSGLAPDASFDVATKTVGGALEVTVSPGSQVKTDEGGVLMIPGAKRK